MTDFVAISLHLKANDKDNSDTPKHRALEGAEIVSHLAKLQKFFKDQDMIPLGDFNTRAGSEQVIDAFELAGFRDENANDLGTYQLKSPFDRVLHTLSPAERKGGFEVIRLPGVSKSDFYDDYSDHYMGVTTIRIVKDDD